VLDERIVALARKTSGTQLKDLDQPLAMSAGGIKIKWHGYGQKYLYLMQLYEQEIGRRAEVIWRNLLRAHGSLGSPHTATLHADLVEVFRWGFDAAIDDLRPRFEADMRDADKITKGPDWQGQLANARNHEFARYESEISHFVAALKVTRERGNALPAASYVIHGNVGAVVTGAGAVTNIVQNIGVAQREELLKALELVREALAQAPELTDHDRGELREIVDDAAEEVGKDRPNARLLTVTLQTLAAAVQGISSGPGAYEVLRSAAAAIGIPV